MRLQLAPFQLAQCDIWQLSFSINTAHMHTHTYTLRHIHMHIHTPTHSDAVVQFAGLSMQMQIFMACGSFSQTDCKQINAASRRRYVCTHTHEYTHTHTSTHTHIASLPIRPGHQWPFTVAFRQLLRPLPFHILYQQEYIYICIYSVYILCRSALSMTVYIYIYVTHMQRNVATFFAA